MRRNLFTTVRSEGALLPPDFLQRLIDPKSAIDGLTAAAYHLAEGERLNEVASRSWNRLLGVWASFQGASGGLKEADAASGLTREKWLLPLFQELGYGRLQSAKSFVIDGKTYPISHVWARSPIHLVGRGVELDVRTAGVAGAARTTPHGLVQEFLNRSNEYLWGFVSNGLKLRVLRDSKSFTRQAFVEFDLLAMFEGQAYSDFALLWLLCHESRVELEDDHPERCWLEKWTEAARRDGTRALDRLRDGVEAAIKVLGSGFLKHTANRALLEKLRSGSLDTQDYYRQLLREVYRLIFLLVAEDRDLLLTADQGTVARNRYSAYYSAARLRTLAERRRGTQHTDLWRALGFVIRQLSSDTGCPELGIPALGSFLWSDRTAADLDGCELANVDLLDAVRSLAFTTESGLRRAVDYRNLGPEELGSVYESLLELHPLVNADAASFELRSEAGNERRSTGSYYTASTLIDSLLDSALDPVLDEARKTTNPAQSILRLKVCDPACGSGHFLIAAAHRIASRLASIRTGDDEASPPALRSALREVVSHCVYGVDQNPMSVELCKVNLWLETLNPGKPLSFVDHHVRLGNSLLGTTPALIASGIPDEAFDPLEGDDEEACSLLKKRNKSERAGLGQLFADEDAEIQARLAEAAAALEQLSDERLEDVRQKEAAFRRREETDEYHRKKLLADTWCAAFFIPKRFAEAGMNRTPIGVTQRYINNISTDAILPVDRPVIEEVKHIAATNSFFHWHLIFPDVFRLPPKGEDADNSTAGWSGGFDVVLGNPPWISLTGRFAAKDFDPRLIQFGTVRHKGNTYMPNTYEMFIRLALETTRRSGFVALLVPERFAFNVYLQPLRTVIVSSTTMMRVVFRVPFPGVTVDVLAFAIRKIEPPVNHDVFMGEWGSTLLVHRQSDMLKHPVHAFEYFTSVVVQDLMARVVNNPRVVRLDTICSTTSGFGGKSKLVTSSRQSGGQREVLKGESIRRYGITHSFWFEFVAANITGRTTDRDKLGAIPKVLLRKTGDSLIATLDESGRFPEQSLYFLFGFAPHVAPIYILGLLNSTLLNYYFKRRCLTNADSIAQVKKTDLDSLPIRIPEQNSEPDVRDRQQIIECVDQLLRWTEASDGSPQARENAQHTIDQAVYRLYALTEDQIAIVESESKPADIALIAS